MRPDETPSPQDTAAAAAARQAAFDRKQRWKEQPGNRYTPEELRELGKNFGEFTILKHRAKVMFID